VGDIEQVPPVYSACNIDGHRAYKMARRGEKVELKPKQLHIDELEMTAFDPVTMQLSIRVVCSKGTYIRALARDIGEALGSGAFLTMLCRTRVGEVTLDQCIALDDFNDWLDKQNIVCRPNGYKS
jgi:tRNA pseudouridine55 synthase